MATCKVIVQKSAEAIVGAEVAIDGMAIGNEPRPTMGCGTPLKLWLRDAPKIRLRDAPKIIRFYSSVSEYPYSGAICSPL